MPGPGVDHATRLASVERGDADVWMRCKVSDSRGKSKERLAIHIRHAGKDVAVMHRFLRKGRGTIDVPLSRSLKGRYDVVVVLDDGTAARRTIRLR